MRNIISTVFIVVFISTIGPKILAAPPSVETSDDGVVSIFVDPEEYDSLGEDFWRSTMLKRASFWSPHPSDYNPMRRPGPIPRNSKRDRDHPYHPFPRVFTSSQRLVGMSDDFPEDQRREKKQTRTAALLFHLGPIESANGIRKPGQKYVPSEPRSK